MTHAELEITADQVVDFVARYLASNGYGEADVTTDSDLAELGLDSISTVGMLIAARDELVASGRLDPAVKLPGMAPVVTVGDLVTLFQSMTQPPL
jgi:acyl carrier protein